jgi:hypothetical protein
MTDGGLETTMIFLEDIDLPKFAAIDLMRTPAGIAKLDEAEQLDPGNPDELAENTPG